MALTKALPSVGGLPDQTGNAGKYLTTDATTPSWSAVTPPSIVRSARTSNTILAAADSQSLIDITSGTFSQTFTAAATLGSGWFCYIRNSGTGVITLDPNASETIDGTTTFTLQPGNRILVQCDGSNFYSAINNALAGNSSVYLTTGNGYGSTNTAIRRFTTAITNVGTAITYADSATLGASFTINETGLYSITYSEALTPTGYFFGTSLNSAQLTTLFQSITSSSKLGSAASAVANTSTIASIVVRLSVGDVVRPHAGGACNDGDQTNRFSIVKVAS